LRREGETSRRCEDDYELGKELGSGAFGVVYLGRCKTTGKKVAIKVIHRLGVAASDDNVRREVGVMRRVGLHRGIAALHEFYESPDAFYLVQEFVSGGELFDALLEGGAFSEERAARMVTQIADAAAFLHAQGLCHADIKPENILLTSKGQDAQVKLVDFGLAREIRAPGRNVKPGTWAYWPPEAFQERGALGLQTDMWAIGVVLFILLGGYHPFDPSCDATDNVLRKRIMHEPPDFSDPVWRTISADAKGVIEALLTADPAERLTIEQLMQHPWLRTGGASSEPMPQSESRLRKFRQPSTLRAAAFAAILQQRSSSRDEPDRDRAQAGPEGQANSRRASGLQASGRGRMLEAEMLASAFRVFDPESKGFISVDDLGRVLHSMGKGGASAQQLHQTLSDAAQGDREGRRVLYGDFVNLLGQTEKRSFAPGEIVFAEGDAADGFRLLLSGKAEVLKQMEDGKTAYVNTLQAGDFFGENALLSNAPRNATVRCVEPMEVLCLSREDFEQGFLCEEAASGSQDGTRRQAAAQTLGFIRMVSQMQRSRMAKGEIIFREGDVGDRFFIIEDGEVIVESAGKKVNHLQPGDCFGETALLTGARRNATVHCSTPSCQLLSLGVDEFHRLTHRSSALHHDLEGVAAARPAGRQAAA